MLPLKVKSAMWPSKRETEKEKKIEKRKKEKKRIKKKGATLLSFIHTCAHVSAPAVFIVIICAHV
jgi:hypothetical protein